MKIVTRETKKIRKGDKVLVIAGNARGQSGEVISILGDRAKVQGVKMCTKAVKKSPTAPDGFTKTEQPIHVSNLKVMVNNRPVKLKVKEENGVRGLYYFENGQDVRYRTIKQS